LSDRARLDAAMRDVLVQLATCSHVPAAGYQPTGRSPASDEPQGGKRPPGDLGPTVYARLYGPPFFDPREQSIDAETRNLGEMLLVRVPATTDEEREIVLKAARNELSHLRGHETRPRPRGETAAELAQRIVVDYEGIAAREVSYRCRCGITQVWKARASAGRDRDYGRLPPGQRLESETRRQRARELADSGHTLAQISRLLGASRSTVERDLGRRAA
jgi:hypothetical protein